MKDSFYIDGKWVEVDFPTDLNEQLKKQQTNLCGIFFISIFIVASLLAWYLEKALKEFGLILGILSLIAFYGVMFIPMAGENLADRIINKKKEKIVQRYLKTGNWS